MPSLCLDRPERRGRQQWRRNPQPRVRRRSGGNRTRLPGQQRNRQKSANDADGHSLGFVLITSLPLLGTLRLSGILVAEGQEISAVDIIGGKLTYAPEPGASGDGYAACRRGSPRRSRL
jgi:hypothetical protein